MFNNRRKTSSLSYTSTKSEISSAANRPSPLAFVAKPRHSPKSSPDSTCSLTPNPISHISTARPSCGTHWRSPLRAAMESAPNFPLPSHLNVEEQDQQLTAVAAELNYLTASTHLPQPPSLDTATKTDFSRHEMDPIIESFAASATGQSHPHSHHSHRSSSTTAPPAPRINPHAPLQSPCFVHSHLDNSLSFGRRQEERRQRSKSRNRGRGARDQRGSSDDEGATGSARNVTQVLAETASSVREMSKQLRSSFPILSSPCPLSSRISANAAYSLRW